MVRPAKTFLTVLLLAGLCLAASPAGAATASQKPRATRAKAAKAKVEPSASAPAPPPPTPGQLPPSPPQVSFRDGLLTVNAQNSTLADVLAAVRAQTGATIDLPAGSGSERVFFHQGPAPARDVLAALLKGSSFDYIILGPPERPGDVQRVLLLVKPAGADSTVAAGAQTPPAPVVNPNPDLDESNEEGIPDESSPMPEPAAPEPVQPTPAPNQPKTPEQLLEELRQQQQRLQQQQQQQQQQQRQQQQQQNPPPQPPDSEPQ
jgi:hypothetical protein